MKLLVSAGPTREFFDSVRFISNASSGRMGYAIARVAASLGHDVTLVTGPVAIDPPRGVKVVRVVTSAEMSTACRKAFAKADAAIMTAAVCDYRPARPSVRKTPKSKRPLRVVLQPTEDIAAALGKRKGRRILVGFALEDHDGRSHAERKLRTKRFDMIVLNSPANIGTEKAVVEFYVPSCGWTSPIRGTKTLVARRIIRMLETLISLHS